MGTLGLLFGPSVALLFQDTISDGKKSNLWLLGKRSEIADLNKIPSNISIVQGFPELIDRLEKLKDTA